MENMSDALQMAAFVLIFILALSISINAFGEARQTAQIILDNADREYDYTYINSVKDSNGDIITQRKVRGETIIPAIYKAYKENYKIIFKDLNGRPMKLYEKNGNPIHYIDLEKEVLGSDARKRKIYSIFIRRNK